MYKLKYGFYFRHRRSVARPLIAKPILFNYEMLPYFAVNYRITSRFLVIYFDLLDLKFNGKFFQRK